jgi:sulfate transport system substrate-binding protein
MRADRRAPARIELYRKLVAGATKNDERPMLVASSDKDCLAIRNEKVSISSFKELLSESTPSERFSRQFDPIQFKKGNTMHRRQFFVQSLTQWLGYASLLLFAGLAPGVSQAQPAVTLLNVSYDPTRELYAEYNAAFARYWKAKSGQTVTIKQSHGGSGKQARSVIDGLDADVVTLALAGDVEALHKNGGWIPADWQKRLPHNSAPYTSTIVLVVRQGNPKGIKDWDDLIKPGISVITPNPKTSGGARWNYLAAWEFAKRKLGSDAKAKEFVARLYANVPVLDTGARGSSITFAQRNQGDVFISWENEAYLLEKEFGNKVDVVYPSLSILAEPPVTVVDKNVERKASRAVAEEYLKYLYSEEGQDIAGKNFYRPAVSEKAKLKYAKQFPKLNLFRIDEAFGGWAKADKDHFADGGSFDQIYAKK